MTLRRLLLQSACFHWRSNLAVFLGVAVGTAVLTGALLVGDSLRGSLRALTFRQLAWVENVLVSGRFVRQELAQELGADQACGVVLLQGSAARGAAPDAPVVQHAATVGKITIHGVDSRFWEHGDPGPLPAAFWDSDEEKAVLSQSLAQALGVSPGKNIVLHLQKASDVARETWLGRGDAIDVVGTVPLAVAAVVPDDSYGGRFNLRPSSTQPRNVFVPLRTLQDKLDLGRRVNALLVGAAKPEVLKTALAKNLSLDDWRLILNGPDARAERSFRVLDPRNRTDTLKKLRWEGRIPEELARQADAEGGLRRGQFVEFYRRHHPYLSLESRQLLLDGAVETAALAAAEETKLPAAPTLVYLANTIASEHAELGAFAAALDPAPLAGLRETLAPYFRVPYSIVAALDFDPAAPLEPFVPPGSASQPLTDDEIILVDWKQSPLQGRLNDPILLRYFEPERHGSLGEEVARFRLRGWLPLAGVADDPDLTPALPGVTDRLDVRDWSPPFPYDSRRLVRPRDDDYWKRYRTTPKAYVTLKAGQALWHSRFGRLTSIRLAVPPGRTTKEAEDQFRASLLAHLTPESGGLVFNPIREEALLASTGGTDFGELFLGFSFFLIAASLLLVGLLVRLSLERRAAEVGLLFALGFRRSTVRWLLLAEGGLVAALGAIAGCLGAIGYAWLMLEILRRLWPGGLDDTFLHLNAEPRSFAIGYVSSVVISVVTIAWAVRGLGKAAPSALLQGEVKQAEPVTGGGARRFRVSSYVLSGSLLGAICCLAVGTNATDHEVKAGTFFGSGFLLLVAGLTAAWVWMGRAHRQTIGGHGWAALARLGTRNATRNRVRSLLTAGLLAAAAFLIVAVDSFRQQPAADFYSRTSSSGGFTLMAESDVPIFVDLNTTEGRDKLNFSSEARAALKGVTIYGLRLRGGDDASCLNLYQPRRPRLLGVPRTLIDRAGFHFQKLTKATDPAEGANPWRLLLRPVANHVVPVFGEANTVTYVLKSGVDGEQVTIPDQEGVEQRLRIVGLLENSIFQSELLTSEENFLKLYPAQGGYNFFLIETSPGQGEEVKELLQTALADFGFEATPTRERLAAYQSVENTYLSTFQVLGSLGLLLGALGLAVVLLRNVWERRGELALLRALGYPARALGWLVFAEHAFLLALGLVIGTAAALLSVAPHLFEAGGNVPILRLLGVLALVLGVGLAAGVAAVYSTLQAPLLPALRKE